MTDGIVRRALAIMLVITLTTIALGIFALPAAVVEAASPASTVWAWGCNEFGELGNGSKTDSNTPVQVSGLTGVTSVAAGEYHSLALRSDGTVWVWGDYGSSKPGYGNFLSSTPVQVSGLTGVTSVAGGGQHSLALRSDRTVWAWGDNSYGELGNGSNTDSNTPVQVSGLIGVTAVAAGNLHSLALRSDGTVWAWGYNSAGELGDGSYTNSNTPVQVSGLTGVTSVAAGEYHSLALRSDGTVWAWGSNIGGQLGDGSDNISNTPVQVSGLTGVTSVAAGSLHSLALRSDGTVWAWGSNSGGELGDGSYIDHNTPVQVSGLTGVTSVTAGWYHNLALRSDGTVWAWGAQVYGELGNGSYTNSNTPVHVSGLTGVTAVAAGLGHSLAIKNSDIVLSPTATSLAPNYGVQGQTLTGVIINGTNLAGATAITFSGTGVTASNLVVNSAGTQITANVTISSNAILGERDVTVTTPMGTSAALVGGFTATSSSVPEWRQDIMVGDILFDPTALDGIGHTAMYIGNGQTIEAENYEGALGLVEPTYPGVVVDKIENWDKKDGVYLIRVKTTDEIRQKAALFCKSQLGILYNLTWTSKSSSPENLTWYCSELDWAAYYNQDPNNLNLEWTPDAYAITPLEIYLDALQGVNAYVVSHFGADAHIPQINLINPFITVLGYKVLDIYVLSPVHLEVIDPDGLSINSDSSTIPGAIYVSDDIDGNTNPHKFIYIPTKKMGDYIIHVIPDVGAAATDTFTLGFCSGDQITMLADTMPISKIPSQGFTIQFSSDATLSNLAISSGILTPAFASGTTGYTDSVGNAVSSVTVTPTVNQANATVTVNGTPVTSGTPSGAITLAVGPNTINVAVTAQDTTTVKTYSIVVTRAAPLSNDATLSNLVISSGILTPAFASGTTGYTDSAGNAVSSVTVTPTVNQANATVTVNGMPVTSGTPSGAITLAVGPNTINVAVTAQDTTTVKTYSIVVTRAAPLSNDATLSNLAISSGILTPAFASGTTGYTDSVGNAVSSVTVTPTVNQANATVTVNGTPVTSGTPSGAITLAVGPNTINVAVTAQDTTTVKTYNIVVNRATLPFEGKPTRTFLGAYPNPSDYGKPVRLIVVVFRVGGNNTPEVFFHNGELNPDILTQRLRDNMSIPTGTVVFKDGPAMIGTVPLDKMGMAILNFSSLSVGKHSITAEYSGNINYNSSTSSVVTQIVQYNTSTKVTSSINPSIVGQSVTFTSTISSSSGTPTGTVTFKDWDTTIAKNIPLVGNKATFNTSSLPAGIHNISATYNGDDSFAMSSDNLNQMIKKASSTIKIISSLNPSNRGQSITFTTTVSAVFPAIGIPTGRVIFKDGNTIIGEGVIDLAGVAKYSTSFLPKGMHNITATYIGDFNFNGSDSPGIVQTVK